MEQDRNCMYLKSGRITCVVGKRERAEKLKILKNKRKNEYYVRNFGPRYRVNVCLSTQHNRANAWEPPTISSYEGFTRWFSHHYFGKTIVLLPPTLKSSNPNKNDHKICRTLFLNDLREISKSNKFHQKPLLMF